MKEHPQLHKVELWKFLDLIEASRCRRGRLCIDAVTEHNRFMLSATFSHCIVITTTALESRQTNIKSLVVLFCVGVSGPCRRSPPFYKNLFVIYSPLVTLVILTGYVSHSYGTYGDKCLFFLLSSRTRQKEKAGWIQQFSGQW